jgi:hypothetical protein
VIHENESPLAGANVDLRYPGARFHVHDWWDRVQGTSWKGNDQQICVEYAERRQAAADLPDDDNVLYGWYDDGTEALVHVYELDTGPGPSSAVLDDQGLYP